MPRHELTYTVKSEGRDRGKVFHIVELDAFAAEDWAMRAFLALARGGVDIPPDIAQAGLAGVAALGLRALSKLKPEDARPLLREMLDCVRAMPNPSAPEITRKLVTSDIEEVKTLLELRQAVIELHTGFSFADALSKSAAASATKESTSPSTPTSPESLGF